MRPNIYPAKRRGVYRRALCRRRLNSRRHSDIPRASASFGDGSDKGRRFFMGYGAGHGAMWRSLLDRLEKFAENPAQEAAAIEGASRHFLCLRTGWTDGIMMSSGTSPRRPVNQPAQNKISRAASSN